MSLQNDPDLRIAVKLVNLLFLTDSVEWTDPKLVGHSDYEIFEGKDVLVTEKTIAAFSEWMETRTFPFHYDHAVGLFK